MIFFINVDKLEIQRKAVNSVELKLIKSAKSGGNAIFLTIPLSVFKTAVIC